MGLDRSEAVACAVDKLAPKQNAKDKTQDFLLEIRIFICCPPATTFAPSLPSSDNTCCRLVASVLQFATLAELLGGRDDQRRAFVARHQPPSSKFHLHLF